MTTPAIDWLSLYGPNSEMYRQELAAFNSSRDQFLSHVLDIGNSQQGRPPQQLTTPSIQQGQPLLQQQSQPQGWKDEDLVGAATYWGIPEAAARAMPRDQLIGIVNQFRTNARQPEEGFAAALGRDVSMAGAIPAMFAIGAGEAITGGVARLPIIGEALGRLKVVHDADQFLRRAEESIRASTPENFQWVNSGANIAGNLASMWFPAAGAWSLAGKVGAAISWAGVLGETAGPIARLATQGSLSGVLLAGAKVLPSFGGDRGAFLQTMTGHAMDPSNRAEMADAAGVVGAGAAFPLAWEAASPLFNALATRVTRGFVGPDMLGPQSPTAFSMNQAGPELPPGFGQAPPMAAAAGGSHLDQLTQLAASGDQQAAEILDFIQGGKAGSAGSNFQVRPRPLGTPEDFVASAGNLAAQMNKAATIVQSPSFAEDAGRTIIDETAVAHAATTTNPGGTSVIPGIVDVPSFIQGVGQDQHVSFARRGNRLDAMISDEPITHDMVRQYEAHGFYEGQKVILPEGMGGTVSKVEPNGAWVQPIYHNVPHFASFDELHPWLTSPGAVEVPQAWDAFNAYADRRVGETVQAMGGALSPAQVESVRSSNLQQYMQDFFADAGVTTPAQQARLRTYFNQRYVDNVMSLAPEARQVQETLVALSQSVPRPEPTPVGTLDKAAAVKGMVAIPQGDGSWTLKDMAGNTTSQPVQMSFATREAAQEWVTKVNRDLPDISPPSDVPLEVQAQHPTTPQQGPNLNEATPQKILESIHELAQDAEGGGTTDIPAAMQAAADGNIGRLKNQWTVSFLKWKPARRLMSQLDDIVTKGLIESGQQIQNPGLAQDYDMLSSALIMHHNDQHPWFDRATDILRNIRTKYLVDGTAARVYEIEDDGARLAAAQAAGMRPKEIQALEDVAQFHRDIAQQYGLFDPAQGGMDPAREIGRYISHIAQRQSDPDLLGRAFEDFPLTGTTRPFYEYARTGNLNAREMDLRELMDTYVRAVTWQKNMADPFNATVAKWKALSTDPLLGATETAPSPASQIMENWLKTMRYSYHANDDLALDAMHGALQLMLGPEVTRQQARELFNFGLNATHSGLLGYRFNVMARDAQQFMLAIPRAGGDLLRVMKDYATSGEARSQIMGDALDAGAISLQMPRMTAPGEFAGELENASLGNTIKLGYSDQGWRMRTLGRVTGAVRDLMPAALQDTRDTPLHPMYFYGKQSEIMKALVYTAGRDKAARAIDAFREGGSIDLEGLMGDSAARTFDPAWQRQFQQLVASGNDKDAASFLGRQLADATQFKYGVTESPWIAKSMTGRLAMQFGNYSMQYYQFLRESLTNGTVGDRAKLLMLAGGTTAALEAASEKTGWNFRYMNPWFGLGFTVGPWVSLASTMVQGAGAAVQAAYGAPPSQSGESRMSEAGHAFGQALSMVNPLSGMVQNAQAVGQMANSPYPGLAATRYLLTGDQSQTPDINLQMLDRSRQVLEQSMQPMHGPVRGAGYGTTQVAPSVPTYPPELTGGSPFGTRQTPDTSAIPFTARPQPFTSSVYSYQDVVAALHGDTTARKNFAPDDLQMLDSFRGLPSDVAIDAFRGYMHQKTSQPSGPPNTLDNGGQPRSTTPPTSYPKGPPGAGNFF